MKENIMFVLFDEAFIEMMEILMSIIWGAREMNHKMLFLIMLIKWLKLQYAMRNMNSILNVLEMSFNVCP